ncbi:MAG TPA: lysyl oxidase family protein [Streptosporangiaceae bacterium]
MRNRLPGIRAASRTALALVTAAALVGVAQPAAMATAAGQAPASIQGPPHVRLVKAESKMTVPVFGKHNFAFVDPGIYVASFGSPLIFHVQRASLAKPITISQVLQLPGGGTKTVAWPSSTLDRFNGLRQFITLRITNSAGKVVATRKLGFCPNNNPQPTNSQSRISSPYPQQCSAFGDPFQQSMVWALARGWAAEPGAAFFGGLTFHLKPGKTYQLTETMAAGYTQLLHIAAAQASATVKVKTVKASNSFSGSRRAPARHGALPTLPRNIPILNNPPAASLPDLAPLPSWGAFTTHLRATKKRPAKNLLNFNATVAIDGHAQLDVEGFRRNSEPAMKAYQYFWLHGHVIGRARVGTMGVEEDHAWHFQQFARYQLLNADKKTVVASHKEGFCIAPTDPISLLLPGAVWQPSFTGLVDACGNPSSLAVSEQLPLGWADTYTQFNPGEAFDITNLPNGTYYIEIIANPEHLLHETSTANDISLRKVILGGTRAHRTVRVPAIDGIDPEH